MPKFQIDDARGVSLADAIRARAPGFSMPCGGRHVCGKCAVPALGALSEPTAEERALLDAADRPAPPAGFTWRMACMCYATGRVEVDMPVERDVQVAGLAGRLPDYDGVGAPGCIGAAVDIGTTTISAVLFDLESGASLAATHEMNEQAGYGADVLSRIEYANSRGAQELGACLAGQLKRMLERAAAASGMRVADVGRACVTGNTTMLHFLTGLDPRGIGVAPFTPASVFGEARRAAELPDLGLPPHAEVYLPRSVSAYVGADVTCGILATGLCSPGARTLLVDVGTNGEMALWSEGALLCCATAAGPAFEGAQIAMGMPARSGAVRKVRMAGERVECETIGAAAAAGLCGTGLISVVYGMLKNGVLDESGRIEPRGHAYEHLVRDRDGQSAFLLGDSGVVLTQKDVRAVQLAKAAIRAGVDALLHEANLDESRVDRLFLSGGFGSYIDPAEAAGIGLIPEALAGKAVAAGNTALAGAARMLFSRAERARAEDLAKAAREVSLSGRAYFMERYVERMMFEGA